MSRDGVARATTLLVLSLLAAIVSGCGRTGDFGRQKPSYFYDNMLPGVRSVVRGVRGLRSSNYELTGDERELRALSQTLMRPRSEEDSPGIVGSALDDVGLRDDDSQHERRIAHDAGTSAYATRRRSPRASALMAQIDSDRAMLRRFATVAARVYRADAARRDLLARSVDRSADDILDATGRIEENRQVVADTIVALENRLDDYRLELRRSMLQRPDRAEARVAAAIDRFENGIYRLRTRLRVYTQYNTAARMPIRLGKLSDDY